VTERVKVQQYYELPVNFFILGNAVVPGKVFDALEKAGRDIMLSTSVCTQDVVTHRWVVSMLSKSLVAQFSDNSGWKFRSY
jgi:hypothetical protein